MNAEHIVGARRNETRAEGVQAPRQRPLVMMVEDDPDDRRIYGAILCYNGFDVLLAPDGLSAVFASRTHQPDLIVLDLGLPDGNGLEICRTLSARADGRSVPVIALSGFRERDMGQPARSAGCSLYIEKPTSPLRILQEIEARLGRPPIAGVGNPPRLIDV